MVEPSRQLLRRCRRRTSRWPPARGGATGFGLDAQQREFGQRGCYGALRGVAMRREARGGGRVRKRRLRRRTVLRRAGGDLRAARRDAEGRRAAGTVVALL